MVAPLSLDSDVSNINGVGPRFQKLYERLGVFSVFDLLRYYPRKYHDYSQIEDIKSLRPGIVTIKAKIKHINGRYGRNGLHITEAIASDGTGDVRLVWFNQPYRKQSLESSSTYYVNGSYGFFSKRLCINNPNIEKASDFPLHTARIVAIYSQTKGLSSRQIRKHVRSALTQIKAIPETLPEKITKKHNLISNHEAIEAKHFPDSTVLLQQADRRLGFEEVFDLLLASRLTKTDVSEHSAPRVKFSKDIVRKFVDNLNFKLTSSQRKVAWQILQDLEKTKPMNRLVEGDVGAGKTVVAAMAALATLRSGYQVVFLAPTTLLANQHAETLHNLLSKVGMESMVTLLTGAMTNVQKKRAKEMLGNNATSQLIVGTHALLHHTVDIPNLGLVIVDEQHRFGVQQRQNLLAKSNTLPHLLSMTATPIPRSLSLTIFGEMDISILQEKPPGRKPVETKLIQPTERKVLYEQIKTELTDGGQMYVVCPSIEATDSRPARSTEKVYEELLRYFNDFSVGLIHGRLSSAEKQLVMKKFKKGDIDILVSTTVIEVGVDVPAANIMMVESPEFFGLAQLHQLRGRIGRGTKPGTCYIMLSRPNDVTKRLRAIAEEKDGFKLAELDLKLRGPGAVYGLQQHGELDLRIASITDVGLIEEVNSAVSEFIKSPKNLIQYPYINNRIQELQSVVRLN